MVVNRETPAHVPSRPQGDVPVIAHVTWSDGSQEWRAARAVRWTSTHVMVAWLESGAGPRSERYEWLRANDVARSVSWFVPPTASGPTRPRQTRA